MTALLPLAAKVRMFHNGKVVAERTTDHMEYEAKAGGVYRIEAWLTVDGEDRPWIYSNPIHVQ